MADFAPGWGISAESAEQGHAICRTGDGLLTLVEVRLAPPLRTIHEDGFVFC